MAVHTLRLSGLMLICYRSFRSKCDSNRDVDHETHVLKYIPHEHLCIYLEGALEAVPSFGREITSPLGER